MATYKPGYKTSEFWFTLVSFLFSGLYLLGIITDNSQKEELIGNVTHAVESCILIGGQLAILWKYINSRSVVKKSWWETQKPPVTEIIEVNNGNPRTDEKSNKTRNRKTSSKNTRKPRNSKKRSTG
jgi:hypothetical protein